MARYLRQVGTKKAPVNWTKRKAARPDMVEYDPDIAKIRIDAAKRKLEDLKTQPAEVTLTEDLIDEAKELSDLEAEIKREEDKKAGVVTDQVADKTEEELDAQERQVIIDKDADIIKIRKMDEDQLIECAAIDYGVKLDKRSSPESMRRKVLKLRTDVIFEK